MAKPLQVKYPGYLLLGKVLLQILLLSIISDNLNAQITSEISGNWNSSGTWNSYSIPTAPDNVVIDDKKDLITITIQSGTTAEANDLYIGANGKLVIEGTLIVYGNLTMANNDPELTAGSDATIIIHGDAEISNKVNINLSSYFVILGNFTIKGGGDTDININDASFYVFGTFDGGSTDLKLCEDYDNNTEDYNPDSCHVGTDSAFYINNEEGLIPVEISDLVDLCTEPSISGHPSASDAQYCEEEPANSLSITANGNGLSYQWYSNTNNSGTSGTIIGGATNPTYTPATSSAGTLYYYCVITGDCGTVTSNVSGAITVKPLPATGKIVPD